MTHGFIEEENARWHINAEQGTESLVAGGVCYFNDEAHPVVPC